MYEMHSLITYSASVMKLGVLAHSCNLATERLGHLDVRGLSATDPRPRLRINVRIKLKDEVTHFRFHTVVAAVNPPT